MIRGRPSSTSFPGKKVNVKVLSTVDYGVFVSVREGVEGLIPSNELAELKNEAGEARPIRIGDTFEAEIANIDTQDRRLTLSMRTGEPTAPATQASPAAASPAAGEAKPRAEKATKASKKAQADEAKGGTIGDLIKQKLGDKLALEKEKAEKE